MDMEKKKILLVEDDQFTRELYEEVLKDAGFAIDTAIDGLDGLNKLKTQGYDLILLDVMMPKMDGLDVLRELMNNPPKVKNGPIVLLTNLTNDPVIDTAYWLNAKGHLVKSDITPGELVEHVKKYTNGAEEASKETDSNSNAG